MEYDNTVIAPSARGQTTREALLEAALRVLEAEGFGALQARRLTSEIGASTMAVYTHFGGMPGLIEAVVREGLARFAAHVRARPLMEDPMADLMAGGLAYGDFAVRNSQLYMLMFGLAKRSAPRGSATHLDAGAIWRTEEGQDAFSILEGSVARVIEAGEIRQQDARHAAVQILSATHGYILLAIGGLPDEERGDVIGPLSVNLMVGLGADRERTERALLEAFEATASRGG